MAPAKQDGRLNSPCHAGWQTKCPPAVDGPLVDCVVDGPLHRVADGPLCRVADGLPCRVVDGPLCRVEVSMQGGRLPATQGSRLNGPHCTGQQTAPAMQGSRLPPLQPQGGRLNSPCCAGWQTEWPPPRRAVDGPHLRYILECTLAYRYIAMFLHVPMLYRGEILHVLGTCRKFLGFVSACSGTKSCGFLCASFVCKM